MENIEWYEFLTDISENAYDWLVSGLIDTIFVNASEEEIEILLPLPTYSEEESDSE